METLRFSYRGEDREVEPHILGFSGANILQLSGWQRSAGWRKFTLSEISGLARTERRFGGPRSDYNPEDPTFARIICQL